MRKIKLLCITIFIVFTSFGQEPYLVKNINPTGVGSIYSLINVNGTLFFTADDGINYGLWKSDGTEAGTVLVTKDHNSFLYLINVHGTLFFVANDGIHGYELWKSDGTEVIQF